MEIADVRRMALALPEVKEQDHHGIPSFRLKTKILLTVPNPAIINIFVPDEFVHLCLEHAPGICDEVWWGKNRMGVSFKLEVAPQDLVKEMIEQAWRQRATQTSIARFESSE